ncbi:karyopherin Kap95 [Entomophthora muscae]|uniref:Karyopherin Kap95 n=1 Tax=Entomophthora muscae TaxID=34485 RepID=A0ACC2TV08_9FUNG|nr:karyopherin Kap95 [Entomophthora muscae]
MFSQVLSNTLSPDQVVRNEAENFLRASEEENLSQFLISLGQVLFDVSQPAPIRQSAAVIFKNTVKVKGVRLSLTEETPWTLVAEVIKSQIKEALLITLNSVDSRVSLSTAQVIATLSEIELPRESWPELIPTLLQRASSELEAEKLNSLLTLGYVCESIAQLNPQILAPQSSAILNAVVSNANVKQNPKPEIRLAAIKALQNSLDFISENFNRESERHFIMEVVCENTQSDPEELKVASYQCLIDIVNIYYEFMHQYFNQALVELTLIGLRDPSENVVLQAIEFWASVSEIEASLEDEPLDDDSDVQLGAQGSQRYVNGAICYVVPILLQLMVNQDEDADEFEWNTARAATSCLSLMAQCVRDPIVSCVLPFIESNINNQDWRFREAAVMAFGSIMDGPAATHIETLVVQAFMMLLELMDDSSEHVRDAVSWTLGRICDLHPHSISSPGQLEPLLEVLVKSLNSTPRIIGNSCWALMNITREFSDPSFGTSNPLFLHYEDIVGALLRVSASLMADNSVARTSTYEALSAMIEHCPEEHMKITEQVILEAVQRLEQTLVMESQVVNQDDLLSIMALQGSICGTITTCINKLKSSIVPVADRIMEMLFRILGASKSPEIAEDIFHCIGSMIMALDDVFDRYFETFSPFLFSALQNTKEVSLCRIATGLLGDICRVLGSNSVNLLDTVMSILGNNIQQPDLDHEVRAAIFSCFGDIASAVGPRYQPFLAPSMQMLFQFMAQLNGHIVEYNTSEALINLFESVIESYVGLVQGFREGEASQQLVPYINQIFTSLHACSNIEDRTEPLVCAMVGLIGDISTIFPNGELADYLRNDWVSSFLAQARTRQYSPTTRKLAKWAKSVANKASGVA